MRGRIARRSTPAFIAVVLLLLLAMANAGAGTYLGGATVVYKEGGQEPNDPRVDKGVLVCNLATGTGVGGACIPGADGIDGILVNDAVNGTNVAFQVCIDNNGDGRCVSQQLDPGQDPCKAGVDLIFFSHDDQGRFFNPLGPLPSASTKCPPQDMKGPGFDGYIVFLCEGAHAVRGSAGPEPAHTHTATTGTVTPTHQPQYQGFGDFCGGLKDQVVKEYVIT